MTGSTRPTLTLAARIAPLALAALACHAVARADDATVQPGQWSTTITIKSMQVEGLPPELAQKMKSTKTSEQCVTPEKAAQGFRNGMQQDANCPTKTLTVSNGILDATSVCETNGTTRTTHLHGPYTPTGYSLDVDMSATGKHPMSMAMTMVAKRTGACQ